MMREYIRKADRVLIFDPLGVMYPGLVVTSRRQLEGWLDTHWDNPRFKVVYRPQVDETDRLGMLAESEFISCLGRQLEHVEVCFDEIDTFALAGDKPKELLALLNWGRKHWVSIRGTVRRPVVRVPSDYIGEITRFSIFNVMKPVDRVELSRWTGIDSEDFTKLQKWEYFEWNEGLVSRQFWPDPY
jgi:hypothetical protein